MKSWEFPEILFFIFLFTFITAVYSQEEIHKNKAFPILKEPYLSQKPPGLNPKIFAPGIISTDVCEMCIWFTPGGRELYFVRGKRFNRTIFCMKMENGLWTFPQVVPFSGKYSDGEFGLSYDGNKMAIASTRPSDKKNRAMGRVDIWITTRNGTEWSNPVNPGYPINTKSREIYPSFSITGDLYFTSDRTGNSDIYLSRYINGTYSQPVKLNLSINTEYHHNFDPVVAPDDSYMIFGSNGRRDGFGSSDLYVSFRKQDGSWSRAKNLGKNINTSYGAYCPSISPDGKYIFFQSKKTGNGDIYWMDAKVIENLRIKKE
jgi:hypothetical protein